MMMLNMKMLKILHKDSWIGTYYIDINDEDLVEDSLSYNQEKKIVIDLDWVSPTIYDDIYPDEEDLLNEVSFLVDAIKFIEENNDYHVFDESPHNEGFQLSNEEISYVDFIGIEIFLSNLPSNKFDVGFGVLADNFNFCGQERINNSLKTFMKRELGKINERRDKIDLFQFSVRLVFVMGCNLFQITLVLRNTRWNELIGHPKDQGKEDLNSRTTNSFQPGETDAGENQTQDLKIIS
jgi:hypothetical protein